MRENMGKSPSKDATNVFTIPTTHYPSPLRSHAVSPLTVHKISPLDLWVLHPQTNQSCLENILEKKNPESSKNHNLNLPHVDSCLGSTYIVVITVSAFTLD